MARGLPVGVFGELDSLALPHICLLKLWLSIVRKVAVKPCVPDSFHWQLRIPFTILLWTLGGRLVWTSYQAPSASGFWVVSASGEASESGWEDRSDIVDKFPSISSLLRLPLAPESLSHMFQPLSRKLSTLLSPTGVGKCTFPSPCQARGSDSSYGYESWSIVLSPEVQVWHLFLAGTLSDNPLSSWWDLGYSDQTGDQGLLHRSPWPRVALLRASVHETFQNRPQEPWFQARFGEADIWGHF